MTIEFEIKGRNYKAGRLQLFDQTPVVRRLMPVIKKVMTGDVMAAIIAAKMEGGPLDKAKLDWMSMIPAMTDAIYSLSDEDLERIIRNCMKVVQVQDGQVWSNIMSPQGVPMFDFIDLATSVQIVWKVIDDHFLDFFSTAP